MGTQTAQVEVLTAEVRVLMVGSRQVTLSVYAQLDWVNPKEITPFGRVRSRDSMSSGWNYAEEIQVIGADRRGQLCRSYVWISPNSFRYATSPHVLAIDVPGPSLASVEETMKAWGQLPLIVLAGLR